MPTKKRRSASKTSSHKSNKKTALRSKTSKMTKPKLPARTHTPIRDAFKKSQLFTHIADNVGLSRKQVASVFEELAHLIQRHLKSGAAGTFVLPGLLKCVIKHKPATKARKGINPFTGEMTTFKARPSRNVVKVRVLKRLKEMVK